MLNTFLRKENVTSEKKKKTIGVRFIVEEYKSNIDAMIMSAALCNTTFVKIKVKVKWCIPKLQ